MKTIEFDLERTIHSPIDQVFARLVDIGGYNAWMPKKGSMLKRTRQTSPGEPSVGDDVRRRDESGRAAGGDRRARGAEQGRVPLVGEVEGRQAQVRRLAGYLLQGSAENETLVRHHAKLNVHGTYGFAAPIFRRLAIRGAHRDD